MGLVDLSLRDFASVLGSDAPAPGGGSAAALSGANGISLTKMVCELTLGKKKYADVQDVIADIHHKSGILQEQLLAAIDKDTEA
ncbi:cyclodeaminase/cyclohydrolase family protein, partial [Streptococcus pluranimalium]